METQPIPSLETHLDGLNAAQRFESYHHAAAPLCHAEPLEGGTRGDARCSGWLVDDILFTRTAFTRTRFRRSHSQARNGGAFLLEVCRGEERGDADGHPVLVNEQNIVLRDLSRPYDTVGCVEDLIGVMIPRHRIEHHQWLGSHSPITTFPVSTPAGRILLHTLQPTMDLLPGLPQGGSASVTSGLVGLLDGLLSAERQASGEHTAGTDGTGKRVSDYPEVDTACLETMKTFLVRNLHQSDLSAATLTRNFHCSRAKVYRLFAGEGGVSVYIRKQRLVRCHEDLCRADKRAGKVQEVAERWGFTDPYHFSRLFKRSFGEAPSNVLGSGAPRSLDGSRPRVGATSQFQDWVQSVVETHKKAA